MRTHTYVVKAFGALATLAAVTFGLASEATAQQDSRWSFKGEGGIAIPVSDLNDFQKVGATFGIGAAYWFTPRIAVRVDGDVGLLQGDDLAGGVEAPNLTLWHYNGGLELRLTDPRRSPLEGTVNAGAGATTMTTENRVVTLPDGGTFDGNDFTETYFTANGGLQVGYDVSPNVNIFVNGQVYLIATSEDDTAAFEVLDPGIQRFSEAWSIPLTAGLRIKI
jgi:hypothetical protein